MNIQKPNDMLVALLQKPDATRFDLDVSGVNLQNTQLLKPEDYKSLNKVSNIFKDDKGNFDEGQFNSFYNKAATLYKDLAEDKALASYISYDPYDFTAPSKAPKIDVRPVARMEFNPFKTHYSRTGVNTVDASDLSPRELAQQGDIFDLETNT